MNKKLYNFRFNVSFENELNQAKQIHKSKNKTDTIEKVFKKFLSK
jgi:hypothetical protein